MLKDEAERLHRELVRRLSYASRAVEMVPPERTARRSLVEPIQTHIPSAVIAVVSTIVAALILFYFFGIGG